MSTTTNRFAGAHGIRRADMTDIERELRELIIAQAPKADLALAELRAAQSIARDARGNEYWEARQKEGNARADYRWDAGYCYGLERAAQLHAATAEDRPLAGDCVGASVGDLRANGRITSFADATQDDDYRAYVLAGGLLHIDAWRRYEAERAALYAIAEPSEAEWSRLGELDTWLLY